MKFELMTTWLCCTLLPQQGTGQRFGAFLRQTKMGQLSVYFCKRGLPEPLLCCTFVDHMEGLRKMMGIRIQKKIKMRSL